MSGRNFTREVLKSGVTLLTEKKSFFNSVSIGLWIKTGSSKEPACFNGISHFIEHLLFKGTGNRTLSEINREIDLMGGALNAFTGTELTCLYTRVLSENFDRALSLLIDLLYNSVFSREEIEKEKGVILQEISGSQDDPYDYAIEFFHKNFYGNSSLGRPILGSDETINSFNRDKITDYFYSNYSPKNLVISVAGNFNHNDVLKSIEKHMSSVPNDFNTPSSSPEVSTVKNFGEFIQEKELEQTHFILGIDGIKKTDPDFYVLEIINSFLGGSVSSRLFQELRENKGLAYSIYSSAVFHKYDGYIYVYAGISPKNFALSKKLIFDIIKGLINEDINEEEIVNAKKHISDGFLLGMESTSYLMNHNAISEIYNEEYMSKARLLKKINSISKEDIKRVADRLFSENNQKIISVVGKVG